MTEAEQLILEKLNTMEESMKMLLVNDVLKDAEKLAGQGLKHPVQHTNEDSQKSSDQQAKRTNDLEKHIEIQNNRIQTLQALVDSKEKTLQAKEECIKLLQNTVEELQKKINSLNDQTNQIKTFTELKAEFCARFPIGRIFQLPNKFDPYGASGNEWRVIEIDVENLKAKLQKTRGFATGRRPIIITVSYDELMNNII